MANLSCPQCNNLTPRGSFNTWQIIVAVCFFPIGLLALLADRKPTCCYKCGFSWQA